MLLGQCFWYSGSIAKPPTGLMLRASRLARDAGSTRRASCTLCENAPAANAESRRGRVMATIVMVKTK
jgi:hypothetical protein